MSRRALGGHYAEVTARLTPCTSGPTQPVRRLVGAGLVPQQVELPRVRSLRSRPLRRPQVETVEQLPGLLVAQRRAWSSAEFRGVHRAAASRACSSRATSS